VRRPLDARARRGVQSYVDALLRFQRTLTRWPKLRRAPDATPFLSLYARGALRGCKGSGEGSPGERLARAFLFALGDERLGPPLTPAERAVLCADVSYIRRPRRLEVARAAESIELGTHGLAHVQPGERPALLLPQVARDRLMTDVDQLFAALGRKTGRSFAVDDEVIVFETESISARGHATTKKSAGAAAAAEFLAQCVGPDGRVCFGYDARTGRRLDTGGMLHGRAASVIAALAAWGGRRSQLARARRWLAEELDAALSGDEIEGWPTDAPRQLATVALATLAGLPLRSQLIELSRSTRAVTDHPWHAAQVAVALGPDTPARVIARVTLDFEHPPPNPWLLAAARALGDGRTERRVEQTLVQHVRKAGPFRGGFGLDRMPEIPVTALAAELLASSPRAGARRAAKRARELLLSRQLHAGHLYAAFDDAIAHGAFPVSPTHHLLRADATAHGLLALLATE
jgi:AMMECR1 domain-containing protein